MTETSAFGWWERTVRISVSTAPTGCEREKSRGTRRRSDAVVGGASRVSVNGSSRQARKR